MSDVAHPSSNGMSPDQLHQKNMAFFDRVLPVLAEKIRDRSYETEVVEENGDYNIVDGKIRLFDFGVRATFARQLKAFQDKPSRLLFNHPRLPRSEIEGRAETDRDDDGLYLTKQYDDLEEDIHYRDYLVDVWDAVDRAGIEMSDTVLRNRPYFFVIFGVGLGFHIERLYELYQPPMLIVAENDLRMWYHSTFFFDWETFTERLAKDNRRIRFSIDSDWRDLVRSIRTRIREDCFMAIDGLMSFLHSRDPELRSAHADLNSQQTGAAAAFIGFLVDEFNMMKNSFRNLRDGTKRILAAPRLTLPLPAVVVASGPSLDRDLEFLAANQDRVVIIGCDSALPAMMRRGIRPDVQVVLERAKSVYHRHVDAAAEFDFSDVRLVAPTTIWPGIDRHFRETCYFQRGALSPLPIFASAPSEILELEGPQVANAAVSFARYAGFREVYFLGLDLGTADRTKSRSASAWAGHGAKDKRYPTPVRGNFGRTVFTDMTLTTVRERLEIVIGQSKDSVRYYNLSDGVRIRGADPVRADAVTLADPGVDKKALVAEMFAQFPGYSRQRFIRAWEAARIRENCAAMLRILTTALEAATEWNPDLLRIIGRVCTLENKALREQIAPRLLRGTLSRMFLHAHGMFLRVVDPADEARLFEVLREVLITMMRRIEDEAFSMADELEAEDEHFRAAT